MGTFRLSHAIDACRPACLSLPNGFQRKRFFTALSTFVSLMTLCAVKKSLSYPETMRQLEFFFGESGHRPSASAFLEAAE